MKKTHEITAVPELLDLIDVKGDIITADAMSCQKKIVEKIINKKADYAIGLKHRLSIYASPSVEIKIQQKGYFY